MEQQRQIKALRILNACLTAFTMEAPDKFDGARTASCHTAKMLGQASL